MSREKVLSVVKSPNGFHGRKRARMVIHGGLNYIKGNKAPYFSVTADVLVDAFGKTHDIGGGCMHDEILKHRPGLADLVALHLADMNGVPMHAEANGWYDLAGYLGGMGERFHAGSSSRNFPCVPPADKPWMNTEHRLPTRDECLAMFAKHCRVSLDAAREIATMVVTPAPGEPDVVMYAMLAENANRAEIEAKVARARWAMICEAMKPRWKAEADAAIAKYNLTVTGDVWPVAA